MNLAEISETIACLSCEGQTFKYAKQEYALRLLRRAVHDHSRISQLKQSRFAKLLNFPMVKKNLSVSGNGIINKSQLRILPLSDSTRHAYRLTMNKWGGKNEDNGFQTSRPGFNIVLQLNFPIQHNNEYRHWVKPKRIGLFNYPDHPVVRKRIHGEHVETLAWSRIDVDYSTNTALIEEIQSDWVRRASYARWVKSHRKHKREGRLWRKRMACDRIELGHYVNHVLQPFKSVWTEAIMMASIEFISSELGISDIYYHTHDTGIVSKNIWYLKPPRSIYSTLPKQFCFEQTSIGPDFLYQNRLFKRRIRKINQPMWYRMRL